MTRQPDWTAAKAAAATRLHADRPPPKHLQSAAAGGAAGDAYRDAQAHGRSIDVRHQAHGLRGGSVPRHDDHGYDAFNATPAPHSREAGIGNVASAAGRGGMPAAPQNATPLTLRDELAMIAAKWKRPNGPQRPGDRSAHQHPGSR